MQNEHGVTLMEVLLAAALAALLLALSAPALTAGRDALRLRGAARSLAGEIAHARAAAVRRGAAVGLRFTPAAGGYRVRAWVDGNGNGVRQADIARGVDTPLAPAFRIGERFPGVRLARAADVPPVAGSRSRDPDPVRLGSSNTLTLSPLGGATSGTIYLRSRDGRQAAVRVLGATGRVRVMTFEGEAGGWVPR